MQKIVHEFGKICLQTVPYDSSLMTWPCANVTVLHTVYFTPSVQAEGAHVR